jgi:hypothetical protein
MVEGFCYIITSAFASGAIISVHSRNYGNIRESVFNCLSDYIPEAKSAFC